MNREKFLKASGVTMPASNLVEGLPHFRFSFEQGLEGILNPYQINKITIGHEAYFFKEELSANVSIKEGLFYVVYPDLHMVASGNTRENAEKDFNFIFRHLILEIYLCDHVSMNLNTLRLKSLLHDLIKSE